MFKKTVLSAAAFALVAASALTVTPNTASAHQHHGFHKKVWNFGACSPHRAVKQAGYFGVHKAHVVRISRNKVVVKGYRRHHEVRLVFANVHGCPVIRL